MPKVQLTLSISLLFFLLFLLNPHSNVIAVDPESEPQPRRTIALLHMYNSITFFQRLGFLTGTNKARYAARHGYDMIFSTPRKTEGIYKPIPCDANRSKIMTGPDDHGKCWQNDPHFQIDHSRAPTFGKIKLALAACQGRQNAWLLWTDADALIVNQSIPLESIIDDGYDIMFAFDWLMMNAGMMLLKCSPWTQNFLTKVYNARKFDEARALDQSAFQEHIDNLTVAEHKEHVKVVPKYVLNVYTEEYQPGDFLLHFAGKLYEATERGIFAIATQFDTLSMVDDREDIEAFFRGPFLLNYYSGICPVAKGEKQRSCPPEDPRRVKLNESLLSMSYPNRYRHVGLRYFWLKGWTDKYDVPGWDVKRKSLPIPKEIDVNDRKLVEMPLDVKINEINNFHNWKVFPQDKEEEQDDENGEEWQEEDEKIDLHADEEEDENLKDAQVADDGIDWEKEMSPENIKKADQRRKEMFERQKREWPMFAWLLAVVAVLAIVGGLAFGYSSSMKMSAKMQ